MKLTIFYLLTFNYLSFFKFWKDYIAFSLLLVLILVSYFLSLSKQNSHSIFNLSWYWGLPSSHDFNYFCYFSFGCNLHIRLKLYKVGHCLTNLYAVSSLAVDAFSYFWKENLWKKIIQAELLFISLFLLVFFFFFLRLNRVLHPHVCALPTHSVPFISAFHFLLSNVAVVFLAPEHIA